MITNADIAKHLDMSTRNVRDLRAQGVLPPSGTDLDACRLAYIRHMRERRPDPQQDEQQRQYSAERLRLLRGQADEVASRLAERKGRLVSRHDITEAMLGMIKVVHAKLGRVPGKVAPTDPALKARIAAAINDALEDLSATRALEVTSSSPPAATGDRPAADPGHHEGDEDEGDVVG